MPGTRATNKAMFWRIIRRLLGANRGRLFVMLLALGAGAAVTAALLNLQVDAKRRLTSEFRAFGPNVIITPRAANSPNNPATLEESILQEIPVSSEMGRVESVGLLYSVANVTVDRLHAPLPDGQRTRTPAVLVGYSSKTFRDLLPAKTVEVSQLLGSNTRVCFVGVNAAHQLKVRAGDTLQLGGGNDCFVQEIANFGGVEDNQIFVDLPTAQKVTQFPGAISLAEVRVSGTPRQIEETIASLQQRLLGAEVRPIRQFTEGEAKIYNRISGLLTATIGIVLLLTALCVMAAMTNVAMERKMDVGLMKAIGGSIRRVLRLFLAEAALLGLAGGMIGAAAGIFLSIGLGKAVFGVAARPRLIVYPVAVALTIMVAILSAYPLRRLASIRPASVFRGET